MRTIKRWARQWTLALLWLAMPGMTWADLRRVEMTVLGMDCAVCAHGVVRTLQQLDGVERVEVSLNRGTAIVHCKPDNTLMLDDFSRAIRKNGFRPVKARFTAIGALSLRANVLAFEVSGTGAVLSVGNDPTNPATYDAVYRAQATATRPMTGELRGLIELGGDRPGTVRLESFTELTALPAH